MALTTAEQWEIKSELGYNLLDTGASAYIGISQLLEQVINDNIADEVATTSTLASAISAASSPAPQSLTLASATSFAEGALVYVDLDSRQEKARIQSLSGAVIVVQLQKAHSGTIPVSLYGPIPRVREALQRIREVKQSLGETFGEGGIKKVDEVEFYQAGRSGDSMFGLLGQQLRFWRNELSAALSMANLWEARQGASSCVSLY